MVVDEETASDRKPSAGGLRDHMMKNRKHEKSTVNDGYKPPMFTVGTERSGMYKGPKLHDASADLLNEMLYRNQVDYHVYFSETGGFHNHRVHHLLAAYALGATPQQLQLAHDTMESTQRPRFKIDQSCVDKMHDEKGFKSMLGDEHHYHDYLAFFYEEFEKYGWQNVVNKYLFSGTAMADDLFIRLFAGIWHNLILLGYGIEFEQAGIVAEGLAGACVHSNVFGEFILECEKEAKSTDTKPRPLMEILHEIRQNPAFCDKDHWKGGNSFAYSDEVVSNAPAGLAKVASQWKVEGSDDLEARTIELMNVNAFIAGAAQRPHKDVKIDFIFIHFINASLFFWAFVQQDWLSTAAKTRLLESYGRINLLFYAASLGPELRVNEIESYKPLESDSTWDSIIQRCLVLPDDGHLPKLIRALALGEQICQSGEEHQGREKTLHLPIKGRMWLQIANMAIDSAEAEPGIIKRWVRGAGSDEAWAEVPDRAKIYSA